ncbi:MAG TPA: hypothetical protein VJW51_04520 [Candidatus Acidoferrales bacterium]|nr:hypothetical protein [Candidatus Acidoferrales bacterium]
MPQRIRLVLLSTALAAAATVGVFPSASGQVAKATKQAAASGQQPQSVGSGPRVMLVISDAVRGYRVPNFLSHIDFGRRLASEVETLFPQSVVVVRTESSLPADPRAYDGVDLVVVVEAPVGSISAGFFGNPMTLAATFVVRNTKGEEMFRARETASEKAQNPNNGADRLGEAVTRQFLQKLLSSASVRNILSPPAPVEVKPVLADTSMMDSAGLDVPPPPPWAQPLAAAAAPAANTTGKP